MDNLKLLPKRKIWDSGGGRSVGETVSVHVLLNIGTECALTRYYHAVMYLPGQRNRLGIYLPGHKSQFNAADWASAVLVPGSKEM